MKCHKFAHEPKINQLGVFNHTSEGLTQKMESYFLWEIVDFGLKIMTSAKWFFKIILCLLGLGYWNIRVKQQLIFITSVSVLSPLKISKY